MYISGVDFIQNRLFGSKDINFMHSFDEQDTNTDFYNYYDKKDSSDCSFGDFL